MHTCIHVFSFMLLVYPAHCGGSWMLRFMIAVNSAALSQPVAQSRFRIVEAGQMKSCLYMYTCMYIHIHRDVYHLYSQISSRVHCRVPICTCADICSSLRAFCLCFGRALRCGVRAGLRSKLWWVMDAEVHSIAVNSEALLQTMAHSRFGMVEARKMEACK